MPLQQNAHCLVLTQKKGLSPKTLDFFSPLFSLVFTKEWLHIQKCQMIKWLE